MSNSPQEVRVLREKVEILNGDRGNPKLAALRRADGETIDGLIADIRKAMTAGKVSAIAVDIEPLTSSPVAGAPTMSDFNALQEDVENLHAAITALRAALT
jgi:hypothetical protein